MTTTAEECLSNYHILGKLNQHGLTQDVISAMKLYHSEKLREAEVSDLKRYSPSVNKKYPLTVDLVEESDGVLFRVEEVLPKITSLIKKLQRQEDINHKLIERNAQLQAEKERLQQYIDQRDKFINEDKDLTQRFSKWREALASQPEEGKTND